MSATDRELLEAAARAAYMPIGIGLGQYAWCSVEGALVRANANGSATAWNPLASDADALRLAVKLRIQVSPRALTVATYQWRGSGSVDGGTYSQEYYSERTPEEAARRAIVRAAAAIAAATGSATE